MGMKSKPPARPEPRATGSKAAPTVQAPIATLPEWVEALMPVQRPIPPHAISAEQYAQAAGCSYGHASSVLRAKVAAGALVSSKRDKRTYYWPGVGV